jgi:AAA+ superfamily predicted ATPase
MAWAWRKRKSIIPGVRLNFGRKGISTTIGPRGASMTFGPNGTYLNTSIPGTGLYNRQKIGSNNNVQMTNDNTGCKDFFIKILSFSLWLLVVVLALMGFAINAWVGCAFVVTLILTHVIVAIIAKNKGIQSEDQPSQTSQPIKNNHEITEEYYNQVTKVVEDVYAVYEKVLKLPNIESLVNSMGVQFSMNNSPMTNIKEKVLLMFQVDLTRCYDGLGHLIDLSSKEGLGLFYFIALTKGCPSGRPFENLSIAKAVYQSDAESILKGIKVYIDSVPALSEVFFISRLLASNDTELHRKFLVAMYRFASITSKADNTVSSEEAEWLGNIMKLQENSGQEIVQAEDEDEQFDIPTNIPHIPNLDPMFADIARWIVKNQVGATSSIQRQFEIGYNRAGKIADQLEMAGIIGPNKGTNGRDVLISNPVQLEQLLIGLQGEDGANSNKTSSSEKGRTTTTKSRTQIPSKELNSLIGLASVKTEVETLTNFIKIQQTRAAKGLKTSAVSYHCVFTGNPGTGKTTVARILAKIYKRLGVVSKGHLVETDRAGLVAEYVGQTAVKTNKIIDSALDGVLFIDEAYSLISGGENDFGKEAIATLLKRMEDNRDRLIVILAGYTKNMKDFIDSNPGLQSRFNRYIEFPDYSAGELLQIFEANMKKYEYRFGEGAREYLQQYFENEVAHKDANFGNGRLVRNVFEKSLERQANRLAREVDLTTDRLSQIEIEDLPQS